VIRFSVVPFRVGGAASRPLTDDVVPGYSRIVEALITNDTAIFTGEVAPAATLTIEQVTRDPASVGTALADALALADRETINILDLTGPDIRLTPQVDQIRGAAYIFFAEAIANHLLDCDDGELSLIVVLPEVPPEQDAVYAALGRHLDRGVLTLVDPSGAVAGRHSAPPSVLTSAISFTRRDRLELFKAKLIVRRGWFPHQADDDSDYVRHHYDGSHCQRELHELIAEYLVDPRPDIIICDSPVTDWLESPTIAAGTDAGIPTASLADAPAAIAEFFRRRGEQAKCLVVVPMVVTGSSLVEALGSLRDDERVELLTPLSILSTVGSQASLGTRTLLSGNGEVLGEIRYVLRVTQEQVSRKDPRCDPIHLGIPASDRRADTHLGLSTYEFWDVVTQCGWKYEDDVPKWRPEGDVVPDLAEVMRTYGAWWSTKLSEVVRRDTRLVAQDTLYVAPGGEEASTLLGEQLEVTVGANVVHVPRDFVTRLRQHPDMPIRDIAALANAETRPWLQHLRSATTDAVVVFDEFIASGGTVAALVRLLGALNFSVVCVAALLDFDPAADRFPVPVRSLYSWHRPESEDS
jgi:hypothetical protein